MAEDGNYRGIRDWAVGSFSEPSHHSNTLYRRIPGYSQGVIVEAPLTIQWSSLQRLAVDDLKFRVVLDWRSMPVPFHLLNYIDPQHVFVAPAVVQSASEREPDSDVSTEYSTPSGDPDLDQLTDLRSDVKRDSDTRAETRIA